MGTRMGATISRSCVAGIGAGPLALFCIITRRCRCQRVPDGVLRTHFMRGAAAELSVRKTRASVHTPDHRNASVHAAQQLLRMFATVRMHGARQRRRDMQGRARCRAGGSVWCLSRAHIGVGLLARRIRRLSVRGTGNPAAISNICLLQTAPIGSGLAPCGRWPHSMGMRRCRSQR